MKEKQYYVVLDEYEHSTVIRSLNDLKSLLKKEGKSTDSVDDLIVKIGYAPTKKLKVIEKNMGHQNAR